jgi:hypothetical protein
MWGMQMSDIVGLPMSKFIILIASIIFITLILVVVVGILK